MARQLTLEQRCKIAAWQYGFLSPTAVRAAFMTIKLLQREVHFFLSWARFSKQDLFLTNPHSRRPATTVVDEKTKLPEHAFTQSQGKSILGGWGAALDASTIAWFNIQYASRSMFFNTFPFLVLNQPYEPCQMSVLIYTMGHCKMDCGP